MASTAKLTAQNGIHGDSVSLCHREERFGMAVAAIKPSSMGGMGKTDMGHVFGIGHEDLGIEYLHGRFTLEISPWRDQFFVEGLYPIDLSQAIMGKRVECLGRFLQRLQRSVAGIVISVLGTGKMVGIFGDPWPRQSGDSNHDGQTQPSDA